MQISVFESATWDAKSPYTSLSLPTRVITVDTSADIASIPCTFVLATGATFAIVCSNSVYGRTTAGKVLYNTHLPGNFTLTAQPLLGNGLLYIGSKSTTLNYPSTFYAVDVLDGSVAWTFASRGHCEKASYLSDDNVLVFGSTWLNELSNMQFQLIAVNGATGALLWTQDNMPSASVNISQFSPTWLVVTGVYASGGYANYSAVDITTGALTPIPVVGHSYSTGVFPLYISSYNVLLFTTYSSLITVNASTLAIITVISVTQNIGPFVRYNDTTALIPTSSGVRQVTVTATGNVVHFILGSTSATSVILCGAFVVAAGPSNVHGFIVDSPLVNGWMSTSWGGTSGACYISRKFGPLLLLTTNTGTIFVSGNPLPQYGLTKLRQTSLSNSVVDGSRVVISDSTNLYAFSVKTKNISWEVTGTQGTVNLLAVAPAGIVAMYQPFYQQIVGYAIGNGTAVGTTPYLSNPIATNNLMFSQGTNLYFSGTQSLWEFDATSAMKPKRRIVYTQTFTQTFALADLDGMHLFVVNPVNITKYKKQPDYNEVIWQVDIPATCPGNAPLLQLATEPSAIFMACTGSVVAFSSADGSTVWQTEFSSAAAPAKLSPCPAAFPHCLYATHSSRLRFFNSSSGAILQTVNPSSGSSFVNFADAGPSTVIAMTANNVHAISPSLGQIWSVPVLNNMNYSPVLLAVSSDAKFVYAIGSMGANSPAGIVVIQLASGTIHSVVQLPQLIYAASGISNTMAIRALRADAADAVDTIFAAGFASNSQTSYAMVTQPVFE